MGFDTFGNTLMPGKEHLGGCMIGGDYGTMAPQVWDRLIEDNGITSMIDVGCGPGHSLAYFLRKGIVSNGVEGFKPALESSPVREHIFEHDYCDGPFEPEKEYDLAWSCEFVEHVHEEYVENFLKTFSKCRMVAMTHGIPGQDGYHHVNCQWADYWIEKMSTQGFEYLEEYSKDMRSLLEGPLNPPNLGCHVKNTLLIFKKK